MLYTKTVDEKYNRWFPKGKNKWIIVIKCKGLHEYIYRELLLSFGELKQLQKFLLESDQILDYRIKDDHTKDKVEKGINRLLMELRQNAY